MKEESIQQVKQRFGIIGNDATLNRAIDVAMQVAPTDLSVLITGESGVGKENFPQIIHQNSLRKHGTYIAVNCGAIPEGTIDSELFGHEKGSFTGALADRKGYFEVADGGTIFLDEVGELPIPTQARLLRVLESGEFIKVGSSKVLKTNVRIVAATNVNLVDAVAHNRFREDLYYRLSTIPIRIPPLRERGNDVLLLFRWFAAECAEKYNMPPIQLHDERAEELLRTYSWPGNVRELKNMAERISVIETERDITAEILERYVQPERQRHLPALYRASETLVNHDKEFLLGLVQGLRVELDELRQVVVQLMQQNASVDATPSRALPNSEHTRVLRTLAELGAHTDHDPVLAPVVEATPHEVAHAVIEDSPRTIAEMEEEMIRRALLKHNGHRKLAAQELGISLRTLYRKIQEYNLE